MDYFSELQIVDDKRDFACYIFKIVDFRRSGPYVDLPDPL